MPDLFRRAYRLVVGTLDIKDLDIAFNVHRDLSKDPNTAEIQIRNLREDHRKQIEEKRHTTINLQAGYQPPGHMSLIFAGDLRDAYTSRDGADLVTNLSTGDGEEKHRKARVQRGYAPGTTIKRVVQDAARAMGVGLGNLSALSSVQFQGAGATFPKGTVLSGSVADELHEILRSAGLTYSIQSGVLQILTRGQALAETALVIGPGSGLLGSPSAASDGVVRATMLMLPDVFPGRKIEIAAESISGIYVVDSATYTGDTMSDQWTIDVDAKPLKGARHA